MKRNGKTVEYQVTLNIPDLRKKINKTCANRPVSCVNGEKPSGRMPLGSPFRLSLWESWRGAPERARTLTERNRRSDSIALPKSLLIAAWRLSGDGLALSVIAALAKAGLRRPASASLPLASCWPRPQQLLPVSATGGGRRRCPQRGSLWRNRSLCGDCQSLPSVGEVARRQP